MNANTVTSGDLHHEIDRLIERIERLMEKIDGINASLRPYEFIPYQLCPACLGLGYTWSGTSTANCPVCQGGKVIPMAKK